MIGVCLTGCGAPGTWGTLECLRENPDGEPVHVLGVDINPNAAGRWLCDDFAQIDPPDSPVYGDKLLRACAKRNVRVVMPQCTDELIRLSRLVETFAAHKIAIAVSHESAVHVANNKTRLFRAAACLSGVRVPRFTEFPNGAMAKPPIGHGSRGLTRLEGATLVTEWLPGAEYTVDGFTGVAGSVAVVRKRHAMRTGISTDTEIVSHPDIEAQSIRLATSLRLRYAWGFQFKEDACGQPRLLECNPRVQGTMVASRHAGVNIPWLAVREAIGQPADTLPAARAGRFVRYWSGRWVAGGSS